MLRRDFVDGVSPSVQFRPGDLDGKWLMFVGVRDRDIE
jgi:hypothetical protein